MSCRFFPPKGTDKWVDRQTHQVSVSWQTQQLPLTPDKLKHHLKNKSSKVFPKLIPVRVNFKHQVLMRRQSVHIHTVLNSAGVAVGQLCEPGDNAFNHSQGSAEVSYSISNWELSCAHLVGNLLCQEAWHLPCSGRAHTQGENLKLDSRAPNT